MRNKVRLYLIPVFMFSCVWANTGYSATSTILFDDFEDGDFTSNPAWTVESGSWSVIDSSGNKVLEGSDTGVPAEIDVPISPVSTIFTVEFDILTTGASVSISLNDGTGTAFLDFEINQDAAEYRLLQFGKSATASITGVNHAVDLTHFIFTRFNNDIKVFRQVGGASVEEILSDTTSLTDSLTHLSLYVGAPISTADFDNIEVRSDSPLPVELSSFTATGSTNGVTLHWRTESETNNVGFNIYRTSSKDGKFQKIGFVEGHGSTPVAHEYTFTDKGAKPGETYSYFLEDIDVEGNAERSQIISIPFERRATPLEALPTRFALYQNYPNPFNPETWIPYDLAKGADVRVEIYNALGHSVRTFQLGNQPAGSYRTKEKATYWDGRDESGKLVSSGLYFYQLRAGDFMAVKRMVILK